MLHILHFEEAGFYPAHYAGMDPERLRIEAAQLACEYLMDTIYAEYGEQDVIKGYTSEHIRIDWKAETILIDVKKVYKNVMLH